MTFTHSQ